MKKVVSIFLAVLLAFSVVGCSNPGTGSAGSTGSAAGSAATVSRTATKKVGMLVPTLQAEFFTSLVDGVKKGLEAKGYTLVATSFDSDSSKAVAAIENYIVSNVDCIMAMVTDNSCDDVLKTAMDKGIKVFSMGVETKYYDLCSLADNVDVGNKIAEMAADFVNKNLGGKAQIATITSTTSTDMANRSTAMVSKLKELLPNSTFVMDGQPAKVGDSAAYMENVLQKYPDTKVLVSFGDMQALECVEVLKAAGKLGKDVGVFACDATAQGLKEIAAGDIFRGTVYMGSIIDTTVNLTTRLLENDPTLQKKMVGENIKVTADNVKDYVNK